MVTLSRETTLKSFCIQKEVYSKRNEFASRGLDGDGGGGRGLGLWFPVGLTEDVLNGSH